MQAFWIEVGRNIERAEREARSHGETSKEAKEASESTTFPLEIVGFRIRAGFGRDA